MINDAKIDPYGGVVFGTFDETSDRNKRRPIGSVYRLSPNGLLTKLFNQVTVSNGIAFSPNGKTMYFTDTPNDVVRKFQIDQIAKLAAVACKPEHMVRKRVERHLNMLVVRIAADAKVRARRL